MATLHAFSSAVITSKECPFESELQRSMSVQSEVGQGSWSSLKIEYEMQRAKPSTGSSDTSRPSKSILAQQRVKPRRASLIRDGGELAAPVKMAPQVANWSNDGSEISTLVLVEDAEYDLQVSHSHVVFANWGQHGELGKQAFRIALIPRESDDQDTGVSACIPLVITVPFTQRFKVEGSSALATPFMPLLDANCPLVYTIEFVRPQVTESDYVWDNFQDQVVIQTRLGKLVVRLQATKSDSSAESVDLFVPRSLPEIRAPSLKLFEYIENNHRHVRGETDSPARHGTLSESFNASKKKPESTLAPLSRPRSSAAPLSLPSISSRPNSSERQRTPPQRPGSTLTNSSSPVSAPLPPGYSTDVSNQAEATAIILKLRARNSTRSGANSLGLASSTPGNDMLVAEEPFPESRLDARTKAELEEFNHLVVSVKEGVVKDQVAARSELDYYRQFLPKAPSASQNTTPIGSARGSSRDGDTATPAPNTKPLQPVPFVSESLLASLTSAVSAPISSSMPVTKKKPLPSSKPPAKLPTLPVSPLEHAGAPSASSSCSARLVENNQETSPVRTSMIEAATAEKRIAPLASISNTRAPRPQPPAKTTATKVARTSRTSSKPSSDKASVDRSSTATKKSSSQQPQKTQNHLHSGKPLAPTANTMKVRQSSSKMEDTHEAALSDFDDPDPEIDDAPLLPDDLSGMRVGFGDHADDDDAY